MMKKSRALAVGAVFALALGAAACGDDDDDDDGGGDSTPAAGTVADVAPVTSAP